MSTNVFSHRDIKRNWHLIDAKNKTLGRISSEIARLIMGKNKATYVPYIDNGDHVVVINAKEIKVSGKKEQQKTYFRHSMYPGGAKTETLEALRKRRPQDIITHCVKGMVPKTKLGKAMIKKLHVYAGKDHEYTQQIKGETQDGN